MAQLVNQPAKVLTVREVSEYLRVHPSTIYRLLRQRQLPAFRVGSDWRFNVEAIDRWRAAMEEGGRPVEKPAVSHGRRRSA
ncbi:MAG TPA: helix-turn-helix domain-containing protein [Candidatus Binataceae bacterium]|nr:helix-turn-helix domain-containing protein [Candidatus Binataceae bacterium]